MKTIQSFAVLACLFAVSAEAAPLQTLSCAADSEGTVARITLTTENFGLAPSSRRVVSEVRVGEINARGVVTWNGAYAAESDALIFADDAAASAFIRTQPFSQSFTGARGAELTVAVDFANLKVTLYDLIDGGSETLVCRAL